MEIILGLIILVYSAILHEIAHGFVADRLGDPTARLAGRLTLDPRPHIDPLMSIILPFLLYVLPPHIAIGGAKPVPIDPFNLREGRKDIALVSLAGPLTNLALFIIAGVIIRLFFLSHYTYVDFIGGIRNLTEVIPYCIYTIFQVNIFLAIFNLLPIPPLDGSKIFALLLPEREAAAFLSLGQIGIFILLILLAFPIGGFSLQGLIVTLFLFAKNLLGV